MILAFKTNILFKELATKAKHKKVKCTTSDREIILATLTISFLDLKFVNVQ